MFGFNNISSDPCTLELFDYAFTLNTIVLHKPFVSRELLSFGGVTKSFLCPKGPVIMGQEVETGAFKGHSPSDVGTFW